MYITDKPVNNNSIGGEGRSERKGAVVVESLADDQGPPDSSFIRIKISHLCVCIYIYIFRCTFRCRGLGEKKTFVIIEI